MPFLPYMAVRLWRSTYGSERLTADELAGAITGEEEGDDPFGGGMTSPQLGSEAKKVRWLCCFILVQKNDFHLTPNRPAVLPISSDTEGFGSDVAEGDNQEGQRKCKVQIIFCPAFFTLLSFGLTPMILSLSLSLYILSFVGSRKEKRGRGG